MHADIAAKIDEYRSTGVENVLALRGDLPAGATEDDCDDLAGLAGRVEGSILNITIREQEDGSSKISVRSTPEISSSDICAVFGGGGHAMAAGCTIYGKPDKARDMLLSVIDEVWK